MISFFFPPSTVQPVLRRLYINRPAACMTQPLLIMENGSLSGRRISNHHTLLVWVFSSAQAWGLNEKYMSVLCNYVGLGHYNVRDVLGDHINIKHSIFIISKSIYLTLRYLYLHIFRSTPPFLLRAPLPPALEKPPLIGRLQCPLACLPASALAPLQPGLSIR